MTAHYTATDRRVYNGELCSDMQREMESIERLKGEAAKLGARCTYFPLEGKWSVWRNLKQVSASHDDIGAALVEFLDNK